MFWYVRFPLFSAGHNHGHTVHHAPLERREERTGGHQPYRAHKPRLQITAPQQVTLHRKKPSKTLRFEHGGRVTYGRGQLDFPDHASVHLEPTGYYIPLWGNKRLFPSVGKWADVS